MVRNEKIESSLEALEALRSLATILQLFTIFSMYKALLLAITRTPDGRHYINHEHSQVGETLWVSQSEMCVVNSVLKSSC